MPNKLIKDLIDKGAVTLKEQGYSIRSSEYTLLTWKQFQEFCNKKGYETYLPSHKDEFITELGKCTPPLRQSTIDRKAGSMKMLDLLATKGTWGKGMLNPLQELLPEFNSFLDAQEEYLIKTGYSECTRETMRNYISVVMRYFQNAGITKLEELNSSHVSAYLLTLRGHAKSTVRCELSRLRKFLSYLYLLGYTSENLAPHVPEYRLGQAQSIIKIWDVTLNLFKSSAIILAIRFQRGRRRMKTADFAAHLTEFLSHYLPELKNISTNTISSYCDAFRLFLGYCQDVEGMRIEKLSIDDLTPELVDHFLQWLRIERNNGTATRSQRLAAIRSFVKYLQIKEPRLLLNFQQILAIPVKRAERKAINPLTKEAIALILRQPDTSTLSGRRDATILCFLYDTAARVQEICDLRIEDVRLDYPASVKILGKGRKTRVVPILPATAQNLKKYLTEMHMLAPEKSHLPLFMNRNGQKLTRAGVTYILNKYAKAASVIDPSIPEKIPPHLMRHTKAMHIYDADNDLVHVRDFLGHSDIKTTDIYARSSLTMKQKALERVSDSPVPSMPSWQKSRSTMEWLKSFGSQKA